MTQKEPENDHSIFRPGPLEQLSHPELSNTLLTVVTPKMWIALVCTITLLISFILWSIFGSIPISIHGKGIVMNPKEKLAPILFYAYFPVEQGKSIKPGSIAYIALSTLDPQEYGYLIGRAVEISNFPVSDENLERLFHNKELVEYLAPGNLPVVQAIFELELDPTTQYYKWTSTKHPPSPITSGTVGTAHITLHRIRPIYYMLPLESLKYE